MLNRRRSLCVGRMLSRFSSILLLSILVVASPLFAQERAREGEEGELVRLFLDCNAMACFDMDYLRREIPFVNWVRDRQDGDVYLLITAQGTGAGGTASELIFMGHGRFEGMTDTLTYVSMPNSTQDAQRQGLAGMIKVGLMRYVGLTSQAEHIEIGLREPEGGRGPEGGGPPPRGAVTAPEDDPWDFWVFSVRGSGSLSGESNRSSNRFSGSLTANRVTEEWKVGLRASSSYSETNYDYDDIDYHEKSIRRDHSLSGDLVRSLAEKWSLGFRFGGRNSTYYNLDFEGRIAPVLEYSFFPYSESTRKSITLEYALEGTYADYREETIFEKMEEGYLTQNLSLGLNFKQPWGSAYTILSSGHHLDDFDKHHASVFGGVNLRLSRGLSLNFSASVSRIRDRISVALGAADTPEDVLLRRQQFQTDYSYRTSIGLTYRFGSIFNNVVNPRLEGGFGGMPIMIF